MSLKEGSSAYNTLPMLQYDIDATSKFKLIIPIKEKKNNEIDLQFPPKITADSKSSNWQEDMRYGTEEFAIWKGSRARTVNVELNYLVWGKWTADRIQLEVQKIKQHLYVCGAGVKDKVPFITMSGWLVVNATKGQSPTFRLMNVGVTYSREYVGSGVNYWPLHTKVELQCKLYTRDGSTPAAKVKDTNVDSEVLGRLQAVALPEWS